MSKKTAYLIGILLTIIIGTLLYCYYCDSCDCGLNKFISDKEEHNVVETPTPEIEIAKFSNPLVIEDANGSFNFTNNNNFNFNTSNFSVLKPIDDGIETGIDKLKDYLDTNPSKSIEITGFYVSDEANNSTFPNLGLARANSVKNYLISQGISSNQINAYGELKETLEPNENNILHGPLEFSFSQVDSEVDDLEVIANDIRENPLVLYFDHAETSLDLNSAQRQKLANISNYLDKASDAVCLVTGHTDDSGKRITNLRVSKGRANFVKAYLIENGISESKIKTIGKGPDNPIASNTTEEGRSKNRRVEITIN